MIQPTQTMECTTEVPYISIYDRPKRPRGRPKASTLTDEEKAQRARGANSRCYYNNHEYYLLQKLYSSSTLCFRSTTKNFWVEPII